MIEGMRRHVMRDAELDEQLVPPQPDMGDGNISPDFLDEIEEEEFGFCTQFLLQGEVWTKTLYWRNSWNWVHRPS